MNRANTLDANTGWQQAEWIPEGQKQTTLLPYYTSTLLDPNIAPSVVLLGGYGEDHRVIAYTVDRLGELGLKVAGASLQFNDPRAAEIDRVHREAPIAIIRAVNAKANQRPDEPKNLVGNSRGAVSVYKALATEPKVVGGTVGIGISGINNEALGDTLEERRPEFYSRMLKDFRKADQQLWIPGNARAGLDIALRVWSDVIPRPSRGLKFKEMLNGIVDFAVTDDLTPLLVDLSQVYPTGVIFSEDDPAFPSGETVPKLKAAGYAGVIKVVKGTHSSIGTAQGLNKIVLAAEIAEEVRTRRPAA